MQFFKTENTEEEQGDIVLNIFIPVWLESISL